MNVLFSVVLLKINLLTYSCSRSLAGVVWPALDTRRRKRTGSLWQFFLGVERVFSIIPVVCVIVDTPQDESFW